MKGVLESLGAVTPFSENVDLTGITTSTRLRISNVIHQTYVSVSEFGTEAAAGTVVNLLGATNTKPVEFMCDRPFIFIIHDLTTRAILFIGKLTNPLNN
jgi:serpin B